MKEAARQLKKSLSRREAEVKEWKDKLAELETAIRETLGDLTGTKTDILKVSKITFFPPLALMAHKGLLVL